MTTPDLLRALLHELNGKRPEQAAAVLSEVLARRWSAIHVRVLLADYDFTALIALDDPESRVLIAESASGDAFVTQAPVVRVIKGDQVAIHLPVSVRGARVGVLRVVLPDMIEEAELAELVEAATLVGYALSAASGHANLLPRAAHLRRPTLAAELQWQLMPSRNTTAAEYELAGHLEPAYAVHADTFDWADDESNFLVSICDADEHAQASPLLTTLSVTALRNARRGGLSIAEQAALADQAVYAHHQGRHSVNALLVSIDTSTGQACAVRAGSPRLLRVRGGHAEPIELVDQLPLGLFEDTDYVEQSFELVEGDRLVLASDGVLDVLATRADPASGMTLVGLLESSGSLPAANVVRTVIDAVLEDEKGELFDDATVVVLDWRGPSHPRRPLRKHEPATVAKFPDG